MKTNTLKILLLSAALLVAGFLAQAQDKKISQLPALPSVTGGEYIPLAVSGTNYYVTPNQLKSWLNIIGYVPLAGTVVNKPVTNRIEADVNGLASLLTKNPNGMWAGYSCKLNDTLNADNVFALNFWDSLQCYYQFFNKNTLTGAEINLAGNDGSGGNGTFARIAALDFNASRGTSTNWLLDGISVAGNSSSFKGMMYDQDYSSHFTKHTLVDSNWVATHYAPSSGAGYVPLAGTSGTHYITGALQYEPSAGGTSAFVSTTQDYYFGAGDNKDLSSASQYGYVYVNGNQNGHNTVNLSSNWGSYSSNVSATVGQTRLDASDPAGQGIFYIESDKSLIGSTNPLFSGLYYDGSTASYVVANGNGASIFHRDYNDARYAPISGGGYIPLRGTLSGNPLSGKIQVNDSIDSDHPIIWKNSLTDIGGGFSLSYSDNSFLHIANLNNTMQFYHDGISLGAFNGATGSGINLTNTFGLQLYSNGFGSLMSFESANDKIIISSNNSSFPGMQYDSATAAAYATTNANNYSIMHRLYNDARYAPISGAAYLSSTLTNGNIYVGNSSNVGTSVTPSLNSSAGTFSLSNTGQFTFPNATNSTRGFLNSSDWTTFNNKQNALSGTGYVYQSGGVTSYTNSIPNSGLSNSTFTINGTGMALGTSSTITADASTLTNTTLNSTVVTSSLTTVGTVTTGVWNARVQPRAGTVATASVVTINSDNYDIYTVTSLSTATTFTTPSGTPTQGQGLIIRIKDNGTARALSFTTGSAGSFRFSTDQPAPTTTTLSKTMYIYAVYNADDNRWDCTGWRDNY